MRLKPPVIVAGLFPDERRLLLNLLASLDETQWGLPTACAGWSVKDIAAHILGDDLNVLTGGRDGFLSGSFSGGDWAELVAYLNAKNEAWVDALRRLSPRVLLELLEDSGERLTSYLGSLDPISAGPNVAWAGQGPHPMWLHIAREYTERWLHQMQIREAVGAPGLYERRLFYPVLDTFVQALPVAYAASDAEPGTLVVVAIEGDAGGEWALVRSRDGWQLVTEASAASSATVRLDQVTAWKLWTKGTAPEEARPKVRLEGDPRLGEPLLQAVAIIA
jgi:uncharacterized protein (TIGR03083 family)